MATIDRVAVVRLGRPKDGCVAGAVFRFALENQVDCSKAVIVLDPFVMGLEYAELAGYDYGVHGRP